MPQRVVLVQQPLNHLVTLFDSFRQFHKLRFARFPGIRNSHAARPVPTRREDESFHR